MLVRRASRRAFLLAFVSALIVSIGTVTYLARFSTKEVRGIQVPDSLVEGSVSCNPHSRCFYYSGTPEEAILLLSSSLGEKRPEMDCAKPGYCDVTLSDGLFIEAAYKSGKHDAVMRITYDQSFENGVSWGEDIP
jgi:hypothetical protein